MSRAPAPAVAAALLAAAAALLYLPGLPGEFVYDDHRLIADNAGLERPFDVRRAFLRDYYASDLDRMGLGYYRPVAVLSTEADYRAWGGAPLGFHVTNLALHAACTVLVFALGLALLEGATAAAAAGALWFAAHPSHAESVAFISGRVDPLATLAGLAAVLLWLRARRSARPLLARSAAAAAWLVALLSKEMAVTVPLVILLLDAARDGPPGRTDLGRRLKAYLPLAVAGALYVGLRAIGLGRLLAPPTGAPLASPVDFLAVYQPVKGLAHFNYRSPIDLEPFVRR